MFRLSQSEFPQSYKWFDCALGHFVLLRFFEFF